MIKNIKNHIVIIRTFLSSEIKKYCTIFIGNWDHIPVARRKILGTILLGFVLFLFMVSLGFKLFSDDESFFANIFTTAIGMIITIFVIEQLSKLRDEKCERQTLIFELGSPNNSIATEAARLLTLREWHNDGTLVNARLTNANLKSANLYQFDLRGAYLQGAELSEANLINAQLSGANLNAAKLVKASLKNADITGVSMLNADFTEADLLNVIDDHVDWSSAYSISGTLQENS